MRTYTAHSGPFSEKPFFTAKDIELLCNTELRNTGCFPTSPEPVRVELFIKKRFDITPVYEELPEGVLGYTTFGKSGVASMHIATALSEPGTRSAENRINSTLAHEAGHGLLHAFLFSFAEGGLSLFGGDPDVTATKILCRESRGKTATKSYGGQWWEHQANMVIGPLLLPRTLVLKVLNPFISKQGLLQVEDVIASARDEAIRCLADTFEVNPIVARIRLDEMYPVQGKQLRL